MSTLHVLDWAVIAGYFCVILGLAWWVIKQRQDNSTDYFLAGRHLGWFIVGVHIGIKYWFRAFGRIGRVRSHRFL